MHEEGHVELAVDGSLDETTLPVLKGVLGDHMQAGRTVSLNLKGVVHITREVRVFLHEIRDHVLIVHLPLFIQLPGGDPPA